MKSSDNTTYITKGGGKADIGATIVISNEKDTSPNLPHSTGNDKHMILTNASLTGSTILECAILRLWCLTDQHIPNEPRRSANGLEFWRTMDNNSHTIKTNTTNSFKTDEFFHPILLWSMRIWTLFFFCILSTFTNRHDLYFIDTLPPFFEKQALIQEFMHKIGYGSTDVHQVPCGQQYELECGPHTVTSIHEILDHGIYAWIWNLTSGLCTSCVFVDVKHPQSWPNRNVPISYLLTTLLWICWWIPKYNVPWGERRSANSEKDSAECKHSPMRYTAKSSKFQDQRSYQSQARHRNLAS